MRLPAGRNQAPLAQQARGGGAANARVDYVEQIAPNSGRTARVGTSIRMRRMENLNAACPVISKRARISTWYRQRSEG